MTTSENPTDPSSTQDTESASEATIDQLQKSYHALRFLVLVAAASLLILTGSLFIFLLREVSATRRQVSQLTQYVAGYEKNSVPRLRQFRDKLIDFAKSNPDFGPILSKYVNPTNYANPAQAPGTRIPTVPTK